MLNKSSPRKYRSFLETLGNELDQTQPGIFEWRFGKPSSDVVEGLIVTKADRAGYIFVVGSARLPGSSEGGVWREGAQHSYAASVMQHREWEQPDKWHSEAIYLESRCSDQTADIIQWMISDWAFERPWLAPLPVDSNAERKRLLKIAQGLAARSEIPVVMEAKVAAKLNLTPEGEAALAADLKGLLLERIRKEFPPDKRGALALKTTVLLARYETTSPPARDRKLCLAAVGPQRRTDPQEVHIRLEALIPANQDYCWEFERSRWHKDSASNDAETRWGAAVPVDDLAANALSISTLEKKVRKGTADKNERAALAILLQDDGRLLEAIELYGVEIGEDLKRLCGGQKIYPPACCAYADEKWVERFQTWMRACAPWLLAIATRREAEQIATWVAEKRGRRRRLPLLKLFNFPGQHHIRKASLMLTSESDGTRPRLEIQAAGSNARLYESAWKRPLEIDLVRYRVEGDV